MTKNNCFLLPLLRIIPFVYIAYYYYFCLFSFTSMYVMNNFSLLLTCFCVGISCLDHLFHNDFPMVFISCFDSNLIKINFELYFPNAKGRIVLFGLLYITIYGFCSSYFLQPFIWPLLKHEFHCFSGKCFFV